MDNAQIEKRKIIKMLQNIPYVVIVGIVLLVSVFFLTHPKEYDVKLENFSVFNEMNTQIIHNKEYIEKIDGVVYKITSRQQKFFVAKTTEPDMVLNNGVEIYNAIEWKRMFNTEMIDELGVSYYISVFMIRCDDVYIQVELYCNNPTESVRKSVYNKTVDIIEREFLYS